MQDMQEQRESFWTETTNAFQFLEQRYGYQRLEGDTKNAHIVKDRVIQSHYSSSQVGIQIGWYTADAGIVVIFLEFLHPHLFPTEIASTPARMRPGAARAIRLHELADMAGSSTLHDPDFLLKEPDHPLPWKETQALWHENLTIIRENMRGVLEGLARATQTYTSDILHGDTSRFPLVMDYYAEKQKRLYPR